MATKRIGIMTTGGDCSGLNTAIQRLIDGCTKRKWSVVGILDGTDGLYANPARTIKLDTHTFDFENSRLAGSILSNGNAGTTNFETSAKRVNLPHITKDLKNLYMI